jgi:hypothetical protein
LRAIEKSGEAATKADPALKQSVTLQKILGGAKIAESLPWTDILTVLESHFSDPEKTVSTVEEVLQALAPFIPGVVPFEEAAGVIAILCKLNVIQTRRGPTPPIFGPDGPEHAPFI